MAETEVQLYSQFVFQKIRRIRWLPGAANNRHNDTPRFVTGTWDDCSENTVSLWEVQSSSEETMEVSETQKDFRFDLRSQYKVGADIGDIKILNDEKLLVGTNSGNLILLQFVRSMSMDEVASWKNLHKIGVIPCTLTGISVFGSDVITCGEDGNLRKVDLRKQSEVNFGVQKETGSSGIYCLKHYSKDEIVAGSSGAQLQLWDLRRDRTEGPGISCTISVANPRGNSVTSLDCHPAQPHLVTAGTQQGAVAFCDLRQPKLPPSSLLSVHSGAVWEVLFHPEYPENLFSCSDDGALLHWDASALKQGSLRSVEENHQLSPWMLGDALADKVNLTNLNPEQILPINSVDVANNWVISGSDSETVDLVTDLVLK